MGQKSVASVENMPEQLCNASVGLTCHFKERIALWYTRSRFRMSASGGYVARAERTILYWLFLLAIPVALTATVWIAFSTRINRHPDEILHLDAIRYYAEQWLPPKLNADGLVYGPDGWSRVYNDEVVYWFYGRSVAAVRVGAGVADAITGLNTQAQLQLPYNPLARLLNIALFAVTLIVLAVAARQRTLALSIGLLLLSTPQIIYLYAYSNSDAWGLSWVIFAALLLTKRTPLFSQRRDGIVLGVMLGMILLSKEPFWLALPFLLVLALLQPRAADAGKATQARPMIGATVALSIVLIALLPYKVLYPVSQGNYAELALATRDQRAWPGFGPSNPTEPSRQWRDKGTPFLAVAQNQAWYRISLQSFYGYFGYMTVPLLLWQYYLAGATALLCVAATFGTAVAAPRHRSRRSQLLFLAAALCVGLSVGASLYHSWTVDIQPQGRYLFGSAPAIALLVGGIAEREPLWLARARVGVWVLLVLLSLGAVLLLVPANPLLL